MAEKDRPYRDRTEYYRERERRRRLDPEYRAADNARRNARPDTAEEKARRLERRKKYDAEGRYREKHAANRAVFYAIRSGALVRQPCEVCGELKVDAHHDDYTQPLAVRWLCRKHHAEHHSREFWKKRDQANGK